MSYCLQPSCLDPQNPNNAERCQYCGAVLRLQNRYSALKPIGQGAFGRTFLAVDEATPLKSRCVIKQFFPLQQGTSNHEKASELFRQEAQRLEELGQHPQIPRLITYLEQTSHQYLVQDFIDGYNLTQELKENGIFTEAQIRELLNDLLPVIQYIHQHQVIHRDIKPANIIRHAATKQLFLVDLGAAKYATGTALSLTGTVIGSAEYTAPEQARGKAVFASDIYSLGATCIHLLTGISPFDLYDSSEGQWVWKTYTQSSISEALSQVLEKMLEGPTNRRYQSVEEVLTALRNYSTSIRTSIDQQSAKSRNEPPREDSIYPAENQQFDSQTNPTHPPILSAMYVEQRDILIPIEQRGELKRATDSKSWVSPQAPAELASRKENDYSKILRFALAFAGFSIGSITIFQSLTPTTPYYPGINSSSLAPLIPMTIEPKPKFNNPISPIQTFSALGNVTSLSLSPNNQFLVSGNDNSQGTDFPVALLPKFAPSYSEVIHKTQDSSLQVWDLTTGKLVRTIPTQYPVWSVVVSPDGKTVAGRIMNLTRSQKSLDMLPLDSTDLHDALQLWNLQTGEPLRTISNDDGGSLETLSSVSFSPDGKFLASDAKKSKVEIWDISSGKAVQTLNTPARAVSFDRDNTTLIVAPDISNYMGQGGTLRSPEVEIWNWRKASRLHTLLDPTYNRTYLYGGPRASKIASSYDGQTTAIEFPGSYYFQSDQRVNGSLQRINGSLLQVWNLQNPTKGQYVRTQPLPEYASAIAVSPDGKLIATAGIRNQAERVDIWDTQTGQLLRTLNGSSKMATSVLFTTDGTTLITANIDGKVQVWRVDQLKKG